MLKQLILLAIMASLVSLAMAACGSAPPAPAAAPTAPRASPPPPPAAAAPTAASQPSQAGQPAGAAGGTPFTVNMKDGSGKATYSYDPAALSFKVGDTIAFTLKSESEFHTFTADELGIDKEVDGGKTLTFSYKFDKAGTFKVICIPHETLGMAGTITVQ